MRPFGEEDKTKVFTEVKLLQIDLDEKYQQLVNNLNVFRKFFEKFFFNFIFIDINSLVRNGKIDHYKFLFV